MTTYGAAVKKAGELAFEHLEDRENPVVLFRLVQVRMEKKRLITMVEYFDDGDSAHERVAWLEKHEKIVGWSIKKFVKR